MRAYHDRHFSIPNGCRFGHVFLFDTSTSNGNITGQSKVMNSCDMRQSNPLRLVTASDDYTVAIFEGAPFKFKTTQQVSLGEGRKGR